MGGGGRGGTHCHARGGGVIVQGEGGNGGYFSREGGGDGVTFPSWPGSESLSSDATEA